MLDIGFLSAESHSQSDIEKYVTRGHIDLPSISPKGAETLMQNSMHETGLSSVSVSIRSHCIVFRAGYFRTVFATG